MKIAFAYALVAQLDRVTDSDSVGRTFESCRAYQKSVKSFDFTDFSLHLRHGLPRKLNGLPECGSAGLQGFLFSYDSLK